MKRIIFVFLGLLCFASASYGEEWEGKKMLIEERGKVIAACEKGILSQGYPSAKVQKYCKCSVDYMTELATIYTVIINAA